MKIEVIKNDITKLLSEKLGISADNVELKFIDIEFTSEVKSDVAPIAPAVGEVDDGDDDCGGTDVDNNTTPAELVIATTIKKVLEKALTDIGYASKMPKNADDICLEAMTEFVDKMSRKERRVFNNFVAECDFKKFVILWQELQTIINKKIK